MVVEALHTDHDVTVVDLEPASLKPLAQRYDVATVAASAVSGRELAAAGHRRQRPRDRLHLARRGQPGCRHVRPHGRARRDDDRAHDQRGVRRHLARGPPGRRLRRLLRGGDRAGGVGGDRDAVRAPHRHLRRRGRSRSSSSTSARRRAATSSAARCATRACPTSRGSRRSSATTRRELPSGDAVLGAGDRLVVVGSPASARAWCELVSPRRGHVRDVVVYGARELGAAIARALLQQGLEVRVIEPDVARARARSPSSLPRARVFNTPGTRRRLPRARGHRPHAGGDLRDARRRAQPVRRRRSRACRECRTRSRWRTTRSRRTSTRASGSTSRSTRSS